MSNYNPASIKVIAMFLQNKAVKRNWCQKAALS